MPSSRFILQQFNNTNPHANDNNPTRTRLRNKLYNHTPGHESGSEDNATKTALAYKETVTAPDLNVYQIGGSEKKNFDFLKERLLANNFSLGGNCSEPSPSIAYNINTLEHHASGASNTLSLQACGSVLIPSAMLQLLGNVTETLTSQAMSTSEQWAGQHAVLIALAVSLVIGSCAFIGAVEYSRMKEEKETGVDVDAVKDGYAPVRLR